MTLNNADREVLANVLSSRYEAGSKIEVGLLDLGSIVLVKWVDTYPNPDPEFAVAYAILVVYRHNKKETRLASVHGFDCMEVDYKLPSKELVVLLEVPTPYRLAVQPAITE